jgi:hypothetical protein
MIGQVWGAREWAKCLTRLLVLYSHDKERKKVKVKIADSDRSALGVRLLQAHRANDMEGHGRIAHTPHPGYIMPISEEDPLNVV